MAASDDTVRDIVNVLRRHVDEATLEKIINEFLDVPGNKSFRDYDRDAGTRAAEEIAICGSGDCYASIWLAFKNGREAAVEIATDELNEFLKG